MSNSAMMELNKILERAKRATKHDYQTYNQYKQEIEILPLSDEDYRKAILKLIKILKV